MTMYAEYHQNIGREITGVEIDGKIFSEGQIRKALDIVYGDKTDLSARLKKAGMFTPEELLAGTPLDHWRTHTMVKDLDTFGDYLDMKCREYSTMMAGLQINKEEDSELFEWVLAHNGAYSDIRINFKAARERSGI